MTSPNGATTFFSAARAERVVNFIERVCVHTIGEWAGRPFVLEPWQRDEIIVPLYGPLRGPDENAPRLKRTGYVSMGRKNGKSELGAALALYHLYADGEMGGQVYSAAADRKQASVVFNVAADMVELSPILRNRSTVLRSTKHIIDNRTRSTYDALSAEVATKHGLNASAIIFDELHTQPNRLLWDVLTSSQGTRRQPMAIGLTTAGFDRHSICYELYSYGKEIAAGKKSDPTFFFFCREAAEGADWTDETVWAQANPALGKFLSLDYMRQECVKAQQLPSFQNTFRNLYLNQWVQQRTRAIDLAAWAKCAIPRPLWPDLDFAPCFGGLDLSLTTDVTAFVLVFPLNGKFHVLPHFWLPEQGLRERALRDGVEYDVWARDGLITLCPGAEINYRQVISDIKALGERYQIKQLAFDRWGAGGVWQELQQAGLSPVAFSQGFASMSGATKELLGAIVGGRMVHSANPVLDWMIDCLEFDQDSNGNVRPCKPDQKRGSQRIDGVVAMIMALQLATAASSPEPARSIFDPGFYEQWSGDSAFAG